MTEARLTIATRAVETLFLVLALMISQAATAQVSRDAAYFADELERLTATAESVGDKSAEIE
ncbi:MAG TPA: hypothetical protein P5528_12800, partial [Steroidobacteraceae bacterium]|nr:hypothetical protein [Steroidobacteraceae bacterium]